MASRCTPEERLADPCQCALRDCLKDAGDAARAQRKIVFDLHYASKEISISEALARLDVIKEIENVAYATCSAEAQRCKGAAALPLKPFPPQQKARIRSTADRSWRHGVAQWMVDRAVKEATSPIPPTTPLKLARRVAATSIAIFGSNILYVARTLREVADDPADDNYQEIAQPHPIELPAVDDDSVLEEAQATVLNEWRDSLAQGVGLAGAFGTALNRAQGAEGDGNAPARDAQLDAARSFAGQWAANLLQAAALRLQVAVVISPLELDDLAISRQEIWQIQRAIVASGWSDETVATLAQLKIDTEEQSQILRKATSLLNEITSLSAAPADTLNDPTFAAEETELIAILNEFAMAL